MVRVRAGMAADGSEIGALPAASATTRTPVTRGDHAEATFRFDGASGTGRRGHLADNVGVVSVVAFAIVQLIEVWRTHPVKNLGDLALIEMETRRVFSGDPPLLGAYSRYGWRHPGAVLFWVWSPIYEVFGESALALSTAAAVLTAFSLWWLMRRTTTDRGFAVALGVAGLATIATMGNRGAAHAWNINATLVPVLVVVAGCAVTLVARRPSVPALITTAWWMFVFETHAGTGVVLAPALAMMLIGIAVRRVRGQWDSSTRRSFWLAAGAAALVAAPTVLDAVLHGGGNLRQLVQWSISNREPSVGMAAALKMVGRSTSLSFLRAPMQPHFALEVIVRTGTLPGVVLLAAAVAAWRAVRGRHALVVATFAVIGVTWLAAIISISTIPTPVYVWLVAWLQPLTWVTWSATVWALIISSPPLAARWPSLFAWDRPPVILIAAAMAGIGAALGSGAPYEPTDRSAVQVSALADGAESQIIGQRGVLEVDAEGFDAEAMAEGVLNELDRRGVAVCAGPTWEYRVSGRWRCHPAQPQYSVLVRTEETALPSPPGARQLVIADYLNAADRRRVDEARAIVIEFLVGEGRSDLEPLVDSEHVGAIEVDPTLNIHDPQVTDALNTLIWASEFAAHRYVLYAGQ